MRLPAALALIALVVALAPADEPPPLLKAVAPPNGSARLQTPLKGGSVVKARVQKGGQAKKGETVEITLVVSAASSGAATSLKTWQSWGYDAKQSGPVVLPELIVPAAQTAPKPSKAHDLEIRVPNVKVELTEFAGDVAPTDGGYLRVGIAEITRGPSGTVQPRFHLSDNFLELSLPNAGLKRLATDVAPVAEVKVNPDATLVPSAAAARVADSTVFAFSSVNGLTQYKTPDGKIEPVVTSFSNTTGASIVMSFRLARGCGVEMEEPKGEFSYLKGTAKELRLELETGSGLKAKKDLVLKDVPVQVSSEKTSGYVVLGTEFAKEYFKDAVYGAGTDGVWKLHGRVKPDLMQDTKTRAVPKK